MNKTIEQLHNELVTDTSHQRALLAHSRVNGDPQELQDICSLALNPISEHEKLIYREDFIGDPGFDFDKYVIGRRRIAYYSRQVGGTNA